MKPSLSVVLAVVVPLMAVVVGCGGEGEADDSAPHFAEVPPAAVVTKATETPEPGASVVIKAYYQMTVDLVNLSNDERVCSFSYSYRDWDMSLVNGPQTPLQVLGPTQSISATANVPLNHVVALAAACWHPKYPEESNIVANASLRTEPMFGSISCHAVYTEVGGGPGMYLSCQ